MTRCLRFMPEDYRKLDKPSARLRLNAPPPKGGGFGLGLKAGLVRRLTLTGSAGSTEAIDRGSCTLGLAGLWLALPPSLSCSSSPRRQRHSHHSPARSSASRTARCDRLHWPRRDFSSRPIDSPDTRPD